MTDHSVSEPTAQHAPAREAGAYRVLARKYRPASFDDLIGQEAMVRTISNAFESARIPQAWILTGVRGVGKTTTARILARALNYELADGSITGPTIKMPIEGVHCRAIMESRHIDVMEMDAASHTGIDDVRQITDGVRYAPSSARYKVYIIDEVHMLSDKAFNAFLKTLEEPPPHAKFIFATTEIRKVPITVLSRCQRFDLKRIETATLIDHLEKIMQAEGLAFEPEALGLIARAAEGSVRDSLSLLDQAIAHAHGTVQTEDVRQMLGLADRGRIIDLFEYLVRGDMAGAFGEFRAQYDTGADPVIVLSDLAEFVNFVTRIKVVPSVADDVSLGEAERRRGRDFALKLSMRVLARMWQMLLKGIGEVQVATRPMAAAEMVLVRIAYAADLPTPDDALKMLADTDPASTGARAGASMPAATHHAPAPRAAAPLAPAAEARAPVAPRASLQSAAAPMPKPAPRLDEATPAQGEAPSPSLYLHDFAALVALAGEKRDIQLKTALENDVRLVRFEQGRLELHLLPSAAPTLTTTLQRRLADWTGRRWVVSLSKEAGAPSLRERREAEDAALRQGAEADPRVKALMSQFPGAEIIDVRRRPIEPDPAFEPRDENLDDE